jgi:hypothetical protein
LTNWLNTHLADVSAVVRDMWQSAFYTAVRQFLAGRLVLTEEIEQMYDVYLNEKPKGVTE